MPASAYKSSVREGAERKPRAMNQEEKAEMQEEQNEMQEDMEMMPPKSRKRSAKGAKETKPAMDGTKSGCSCDGPGPCKCKKGRKDMGCSKRGDALTPRTVRVDLKCGKGAISKGEKCHKGPASSVQLQAAKKAAGSVSASRPVTVSSYGKGPNALVRAGQAAKSVGRFGLETVKWTSGYNIGKTIASGVTQGKNEKGSTGAKVGSIAGSALLFNPIAGLGAARRTGAFGLTDLQQHALNEKKEKKWRKSVGYRDGSPYAKGFKVDYAQLAL